MEPDTRLPLELAKMNAELPGLQLTLPVNQLTSFAQGFGA